MTLISSRKTEKLSICTQFRVIRACMTFFSHHFLYLLFSSCRVVKIKNSNFIITFHQIHSLYFLVERLRVDFDLNVVVILVEEKPQEKWFFKKYSTFLRCLRCWISMIFFSECFCIIMIPFRHFEKNISKIESSKSLRLNNVLLTVSSEMEAKEKFFFHSKSLEILFL